MAKPTEKAVETFDLGRMLAVLRQFAQDAGEAVNMQQADQAMRTAPELPATDREASRP